MTSEVILYFVKNLHLHNVSIHRNFNQNRFINFAIYNVSIHRNFNQNRFINKCAREKKGKISESQSHGVFFVRYRRTYVLGKTN